MGVVGCAGKVVQELQAANVQIEMCVGCRRLVGLSPAARGPCALCVTLLLQYYYRSTVHSRKPTRCLALSTHTRRLALSTPTRRLALYTSAATPSHCPPAQPPPSAPPPLPISFAEAAAVPAAVRRRFNLHPPWPGR